MTEDRALTTIVEGEVVEYDPALALAGQVANQAASVGVFADYRQRKSKATLRGQDAALALFAEYLAQAGVVVFADDLASDPGAWHGITWGLVKGFVKWQLGKGYAVSTINSRLSHVKVYARMANQAGMLQEGEIERIQGVTGYSGSERAHVNEKRADAGIPTRTGSKKASPTLLNSEQADSLMDGQPGTPQGRRDTVLMHLSLKHGLRVSELALLTVDNFTLTRDKSGKVKAGMMRFYRPKLAGYEQEWGEHLVLNGTLDAVAAYLDNDAPAIGPLFRTSNKSGALTGAGVSRRSLTVRIGTLGERAGVDGLTAHDCRHYAATRDGKRGKSVAFLCAKFGWTTAQTALRYVHIEGPVVVD